MARRHKIFRFQPHTVNDLSHTPNFGALTKLYQTIPVIKITALKKKPGKTLVTFTHVLWQSPRGGSQCPLTPHTVRYHGSRSVNLYPCAQVTFTTDRYERAVLSDSISNQVGMTPQVTTERHSIPKVISTL